MFSLAFSYDIAGEIDGGGFRSQNAFSQAYGLISHFRNLFEFFLIETPFRTDDIGNASFTF